MKLSLIVLQMVKGILNFEAFTCYSFSLTIYSYFKKELHKKSSTLCKYVTTKEVRIAKLLCLKCNQYYLMKANDFESIKRNLSIRKDEEGYLEHLVDLTL